MQDNERRKELARLLKAIAESTQDGHKSTPAAATPRSTLRNEKVAWYHELACEQASRESWSERQRYHFPPIIPEDIAQIILEASEKGILDPDADPVAASLMDGAEIRKMIQAGRLDPSELPMLEYRILRLLGSAQTMPPPDRRASFSSLVYYYRGDPRAVERIRKEALAEIEEDFRYGDISPEEKKEFIDELERIIRQYRTL